MNFRASILASLVLTLLPAIATGENDVTFLPHLRLPTIDGTQTVSTWELRGKKLLIIEFASW